MNRPRRALVVGWSSFEQGEATAGDLLAAEAAARWLAEAGWQVDVALSPAFPHGSRLSEVPARAVDLLVFACGPLSGEQVEWLLERFADVPRVALDVSVTDPALAARFDAVLARDQDGRPAPDISLAVTPEPLPVVGVLNTHAQPAYGEDRAGRASSLVAEALRDYPAAVVDLDTRVDPRLDPRERDPRSSAELESLMRRLDAVVTARLHGLVLALRNGVPALAVDVMPGGGKVTAQAAALGWEHCLGIEQLTPRAVRDGLDELLRPGAGQSAVHAATTARQRLDQVRAQFTSVADRLGRHHR